MATTLTRRDPALTNGVRLFDRLFNDPFLSLPTEFTAPVLEEGTLALDVSENDENVIVRASLPGFQRDDINVEMHDGVLTIKAERTEEEETRDERFFRKERRYGAVSRRVALPSMVDEKGARAALKDGVLELCLPKAEQARPKKIAIS